MFTQERQQLILTILSDEGSLSVAELAVRLDVSDDTVRRDLRALSERGYLQKVHGGAVILDIAGMSRQNRKLLLPSVKRRLGEAAAAMVEAGNTIILDAGQTTLEIARALPAIALTVITNSLDIAQCLSERPEVTLKLTGGEWDRKQRLLSGSATLKTLARLRADIAIMGACAVDTQMGVTATGEADASIKRQMLDVSTRKILVADHSKFDRHEPHLVAALAEFDELLTNRPLKQVLESPKVILVECGDEQ